MEEMITSPNKFIDHWESIHKKIYERLFKPHKLNLILKSNELDKDGNPTCINSILKNEDIIANISDMEVELISPSPKIAMSLPTHTTTTTFICTNFTNSDRLTISLIYCYVLYIDKYRLKSDMSGEVDKWIRTLDFVEDIGIPISPAMVKQILDNIRFFNDSIKHKK